MNAKHIAVLAVLGLIVIMQSVDSFNLEPMLLGGKCKCIKTTKSMINPSRIIQVKIFPPRPNCPALEIIFILKNNDSVCIDPEAKWFQSYIQYAKRKQQKNENITGKTPV